MIVPFITCRFAFSIAKYESWTRGGRDNRAFGRRFFIFRHVSRNIHQPRDQPLKNISFYRWIRYASDLDNYKSNFRYTLSNSTNKKVKYPVFKLTKLTWEKKKGERIKIEGKKLVKVWYGREMRWSEMKRGIGNKFDPPHAEQAFQFCIV